MAALSEELILEVRKLDSFEEIDELYTLLRQKSTLLKVQRLKSFRPRQRVCWRAGKAAKLKEGVIVKINKTAAIVAVDDYFLTIDASVLMPS